MTTPTTAPLDPNPNTAYKIAMLNLHPILIAIGVLIAGFLLALAAIGLGVLIDNRDKPNS